MPDRISEEVRKRNMSRVKNKNTKPELLVRKLLHRSGFRYRLHQKKLPGAPDIVLPKYKTVIFVHGCFWHGHTCRRGSRPTSHTEFWNNKLDKNLKRDSENQQLLKNQGWRVLIIWECETRDESLLIQNIKSFLGVNNGPQG